MVRIGRLGSVVPALLLAAALLLPAARLVSQAVLQAQPAAPAPAPSLPFPFALLADDGADGLLLQLQPEWLPTLARLDAVHFPEVPLPDGGMADLTLQRVRLPREGWPVHLDGQPTDLLPDQGLTLWSGGVSGDASSHVYLALSTHGSRGWLRHQGQVLHWLAGPGPEQGWAAAVTRLVSEQRLLELGLEHGPGCRPELPAGPGLPASPPAASPARPSGATGATGTSTPERQGSPGQPESPAGAGPVTLACRMALEIDTQLYDRFGDVLAALTYVSSLWGSVNEVYLRDLDAVLVVPYLNLNTTSDPWQSPDNGGDAVDMLFEFQDAWAGGNAPVQANLFHLLSGAGLGGGVAYLSSLCHPDYSFAVSGNLAGVTPFPAMQGPLNWDFMVSAHETGHTFGAPHTHDLCPPVDECAPPGYFGQCQTNQVCTEGTIMSYCHQCVGGLDNIRLEFHPAIVANVRGFLESWSCLQPFHGLYADDLGESLAGAFGNPVSVPTFVPPDQVQLTFKLAPPTPTGLLVSGLTTLNTPLHGGVLVPSVDSLVAITVPGPSFVKSFSLGIPTPDDGMTVFTQMWFPDPAGTAASNATRIELHWPDPWGPTAWYTHANGLHYALSAPGSWADCEAEAQSWGGHLATVDGQGLNDWLVQRFGDQTAYGAAYIGLSDAALEGTWVWADGTPLGWTYWDPGQPDDAELSGEDHGALGFWNNHWIDVLGSGYGVNRGIMQRP